MYLQPDFNADRYDLTNIVSTTCGKNILFSDKGLLAAAYCEIAESVEAVLYNLGTKQLITSVEIDASYCRQINETAGGFNYTFVKETAEEQYVTKTVIVLSIDWQGNCTWQYPETFRLPFGDGEVAEWEGGIVYIDRKSGKMKLLTSFNEEIESGPAIGWLELFTVINENTFIYTAKYDFWSMAVYIYDIRTGQSTRVSEYGGYPLGIGGNFLLYAFDSLGTEGMATVDIPTITTLSKIYYNNAGHSRAAISGDGAFVLAVYDRYQTDELDIQIVTNVDNGFWFYDAKTGQLLNEYPLNLPGKSPYTYGFWQQRPYLISENNGKTTLYVLPENVVNH